MTGETKTYRFNPEQLTDFATDLLEALGAPRETVSRVASPLLHADRDGVVTHGLNLLPIYAEMIRDGVLDPTARPRVVRDEGATRIVDGRCSFGQLTADLAVEQGLDAATEHGVGVVCLRAGMHLGRMAEWARRTTREGMVHLAFANTAGGARVVAPHGGRERKLSTNPMALGFPTLDALSFDIIADFATSQASGYSIRERYQRGEPLPPDWTTRSDGEPLRDPGDFLKGLGALLPLGGRSTGHKGFALALFAELVGGLSGNGVIGPQEPDWFSNEAVFFTLDPGRFLSSTELENQVRQVADYLRDTDVQLPGEGSHRRREVSRREGIELPLSVLSALANLAEENDLPVPDWLTTVLGGSDAMDPGVKTWNQKQDG